MKKQENSVGRMLNRIILGDCIEGMKSMPDNCIDCFVSSPPYW